MIKKFKFIIKKYFENWLPPILLRYLYRCAEELKFSSYSHKEILAKNKTLKGAGKGKRAFLLATGPSLKKENLKSLAGEDCCSVSNFFLHEDINLIKPKFHFFASYHEPIIFENYAQWLAKADRELPPDTKIFLGHKALDIAREFKLFPNREVHYLYMVSHPSRNNVDITRGVQSPQTGPLMVLPVLLYMEYKKIYLLGCDHTQLRDYKKSVTNFYEKEKDVRVIKPGTSIWIDIIQEMQANLNVFLQYDFYKKIAEDSGMIEIINLSSDSWLDIFGFGNIKEVFSEKPG